MIYNIVINFFLQFGMNSNHYVSSLLYTTKLYPATIIFSPEDSLAAAGEPGPCHDLSAESVILFHRPSGIGGGKRNAGAVEIKHVF